MDFLPAPLSDDETPSDATKKVWFTADLAMGEYDIVTQEAVDGLRGQKTSFRYGARMYPAVVINAQRHPKNRNVVCFDFEIHLLGSDDPLSVLMAATTETFTSGGQSVVGFSVDLSYITSPERIREGVETALYQDPGSGW